MKLPKQIKQHPRIAIAAAVVLALLLGFWATRPSAEAQMPEGVSLTAKVEKGDVTEKIEEMARLAPLKVVRIKANATGRVNRLAVEEGETVKQGQLLAVIQPGRPGEQFQPSSVLAPMSGVIIERNVEEGDTVTSGLSEYSGGTQIMAVARLDAMIGRFDVNEVDIGRIKVGMPATLRSEAFQGRTFAAKVLSIAPRARALEGSSLTVFSAKVLLEGNVMDLRPGMSAVVSVTTGRRQGVLTLPVEAVFQEDGKMSVYKVVFGSKIPVKTDIKTGLSDEHRVEILSGVALGTEVSKIRPLKDIPERK